MSKHKVMKKEEWKNKVLNSLEGIQKVEVRQEVFEAIENELYAVRRIPIIQLKWAVAAASFLLAVNLLTLNLQSNEVDSSETIDNSSSESQLLTNYTLYEL